METPKQLIERALNEFDGGFAGWAWDYREETLRALNIEFFDQVVADLMYLVASAGGSVTSGEAIDWLKINRVRLIEELSGSLNGENGIAHGRKVLVTTSRRGVFAGTVESISECRTRVVLTDVRMCVYWAPSVRGVLGLTNAGPDDKCRISPAAPRAELDGVEMIADLSPAAALAWELEPWG